MISAKSLAVNGIPQTKRKASQVDSQSLWIGCTLGQLHYNRLSYTLIFQCIIIECIWHIAWVKMSSLCSTKEGVERSHRSDLVSREQGVGQANKDLRDFWLSLKARHTFYGQSQGTLEVHKSPLKVPRIQLKITQFLICIGTREVCSERSGISYKKTKSTTERTA